MNWENIPIEDFEPMISHASNYQKLNCLIPWAKGLPDNLALEVRRHLSATLDSLQLKHVMKWLKEDENTARKLFTFDSLVRVIECHLEYRKRKRESIY